MDQEEQNPSQDVETTVRHDRQEIRREIIDFVKLIVWFLVIILGMRTYVIEGYEVQGESMEPYLESHERILVLKLPLILSRFSLFRGIDAVDSGDIVVFDSPDNPEKRYVKRVVAMGAKPDYGKTVDAESADQPQSPEESVLVKFDHGSVYINNHIVEEPYLTEDAKTSIDTQDIVLGPGEYYVLGDNRKVSKDSRSFEAIHENTVIGKAVLRFWPLHRIGFLK